MTNELIWQHHEAPGWEHVRVVTDHPGWTVFDSILVRESAGEVLRGGYTLVVDKQWHTLELRLMMETSPGTMEGIHLLTEGEGHWTDANENPIPELDGCLDVDIQWSPLTNSLPVNRLPLEQDNEYILKVAYIALPELVIKPVAQRYRRIDAHTVHYTSETRDFERDITVDGNGYVVDYPGLFTRTFPR